RSCWRRRLVVRDGRIAAQVGIGVEGERGTAEWRRARCADAPERIADLKESCVPGVEHVIVLGQQAVAVVPCLGIITWAGETLQPLSSDLDVDSTTVPRSGIVQAAEVDVGVGQLG